MFLGTIVNAVAVAVGSLIGIYFKRTFPKNIKEIIFQALGLCTLAIGVTMVLKSENALILIFSVILGGITGEALKLEKHLDHLGNKLKKALKSKNDRFSEGLVSSFLIFCIGSMTIMGTIDEGVRGDHTILFTKSLLDLFSSMALAATFGTGVFFSAIAVLLYQGLLTLLAFWLQKFFTLHMIYSLTATGGVLILGIGVNLLNLRKISTTNLLPALVYAVLLSMIFH
jgi:uncharacterized protein